MSETTMGVRGVTLENFGGWERLSLDFATSDAPTPPVVVVVGGNGSGKTGLLRGVARAARCIEPSLRDMRMGAELEQKCSAECDAVIGPGVFCGWQFGWYTGADLCEAATIETVRLAIVSAMGPAWDASDSVGYRCLGAGPQRVWEMVGGIASAFERHTGEPFGTAGVVFVDDADEHLDAIAQTRVVPLLRGLFPRVQFILSTRSPFVLAGTTPECCIVTVARGADGCEVVPPREHRTDPRLMTATELHGVYLGVDVCPAPEGRTLQDYHYLAANPYRSDADQTEMLRLAAELKAGGVKHGYEPVPRENLPE